MSYKILALSGSLRKGSSNTNLLMALAEVAPPDIEVSLFEGIGELPHYNPDLDGDEVHPAVAAFRAALRACDAVVISCPEYAHGVPGSFKNALDWVVGSGELMGKPTALFNTSARSTYAQASLTETLTVMMARVDAEASVTLSLASNRVSVNDLAGDDGIVASLRQGIERLRG